MKAFGICPIVNGQPDIGGLPCWGYVLAAHIANWGAYLISGTLAQLSAINALPNTYAICIVTENGGIKWPELDNVIPAGVRTRINNWLTARGYPTILAGWTYRQVILAIYQRMNEYYTIDGTDVADGS